MMRVCAAVSGSVRRLARGGGLAGGAHTGEGTDERRQAWDGAGASPGARRGGPPRGRARAPPDPAAPLLADDQAGLGQDLGVVADRRLRLAERVLQIARADLAGGRRSGSAAAGGPGRPARRTTWARLVGLAPRRAARRGPTGSSTSALVGACDVVAVPSVASPISIDNCRCICDHRSIDSRQSIGGGTRCPESSSPSTSSDLDAGRRLLLEAVRHRAGQGAARLRQLRHRRAAAEAGAHRGRRRAAARSTTSASRSSPPTRSPPRSRGSPPRASPPRPRTRSSCCYAVQDKVWVDGPDGEPWEIYTVLADVEMPPASCAPSSPATTRMCCASAPESAAALLLTPAVTDDLARRRRRAEARRHRAARRGRRRFGHRRPAALARRRRAAAARELDRHRRRRWSR